MITYFERIKTIDKLVQAMKTGKPRELAAKLHMSERAIFDYLKTMKDMGAPITYSRGRQSYVYSKAGSFKIGFEAPHLV